MVAKGGALSSRSRASVSRGGTTLGGETGGDETIRIDENNQQSTQTKEAVPGNDTISIRRGRRNKKVPFVFLMSRASDGVH